jgi:hypothetical protein
VRRGSSCTPSRHSREPWRPQRARSGWQFRDAQPCDCRPLIGKLGAIHRVRSVPVAGTSRARVFAISQVCDRQRPPHAVAAESCRRGNVPASLRSAPVGAWQPSGFPFTKGAQAGKKGLLRADRSPGATAPPSLRSPQCRPRAVPADYSLRAFPSVRIRAETGDGRRKGGNRRETAAGSLQVFARFGFSAWARAWERVRAKAPGPGYPSSLRPDGVRVVHHP